MKPDHSVVCCDLDGVVWRGDEPIPGAGAAISGLRDAGFRVAFVSNNSSQPIGDVAAKLGVKVSYEVLGETVGGGGLSSSPPACPHRPTT